MEVDDDNRQPLPDASNQSTPQAATAGLQQSDVASFETDTLKSFGEEEQGTTVSRQGQSSTGVQGVTKLQPPGSKEEYLGVRTALSEPSLKGELGTAEVWGRKPRLVTGHSNIRRKFQSASGPHFNLEVLLKHRELQVVEEEGAKGLVALEQLRRCFLIPHPSAGSVVEAMSWPSPPSGANANQSSGLARWVPPEGLLDGPYSRHYNQWLLQDPRFQGIPVSEPAQVPAPVSQAGGVLRLQNVKSATAQCLYRRKDGVVVSLRCLDCKRENFSSPQGFINHCRIAHQRDFASHEAAAEACGTEVDETEVANVYQPTRSVRGGAASGPYQNTRHQISSTPMGLGGPTHFGSPFSGQAIADDYSMTYATRPIPTTKSGSHRKKSNYDSSNPTTPGGNAQRRPASTVHLKKFLMGKNMEIKDLEGMIELTVSPPAISDTEDDLDIDEDDEERSELDDVVAQGRRRAPPSARMTTSMRSPQKKLKKSSPPGRRSASSRPPVNHRVVKLKISGIGRLPRFDDDGDMEPIILSGAGKDPSVIPRIPPRAERTDSSSEDDQVQTGFSSQEDEDATTLPEHSPILRQGIIMGSSVASNGTRKRSSDETGGIVKKTRPE